MISYGLFLGGTRCVRADAAAVLAAGDDFGFRSTCPAADAALAEVCSFDDFFVVAMRIPPVGKLGCGWSPRLGNPGNADRSHGQGFSPVRRNHDSVQARTLKVARSISLLVSFLTQSTPQIHDRLLAWRLKSAQGQILRLRQKPFGFAHSLSFSISSGTSSAACGFSSSVCSGMGNS